jgi:L-aspartate oxidase
MAEAPPLLSVQQVKREPAYASLNLTDVENSLRSIMWRNCGVERNGEDLAEALGMIEFWCRYVMDKQFDGPQGWQLQNMLTVARLMGTAALRREESRGVHCRTDFPETIEKWRRHIAFTRADLEWEQT